MATQSVCFILLAQFCWLSNAGAIDDELPPRVQKQVNQVLQAYHRGSPFEFTRVSQPLLKQVKPDHLKTINQLFNQQKLPDLEEMIGEVRVRSIMADVSLPKMTWQEFTAVVPFVVRQASDLKRGFEASEFFREAIPPKDFESFDQSFWKLHVFRNRLNALAKAAKRVQTESSFFKRQIDAEKKSKGGVDTDVFDKLAYLSNELYQMRNLVDEREVELRVHRTTQAESLVDVGMEFKKRLHAAFALADDRLFFEQFFDKVKKENRQLLNQDLKDESILKMVSDSSENAKKKNELLFEKATLLYVGAHWWLRGRYGRGPLGNGLLKAIDAGKSEQSIFPLSMPARMPNPKDLVGDKAPFHPVRRHNYVWVLGVDRFHSSDEQVVSQKVSRGPSTTVREEGKPFKAKIEFNRFY